MGGELDMWVRPRRWVGCSRRTVMGVFSFSALLVPALLGTALFLHGSSSHQERLADAWDRHVSCETSSYDCLPEVTGEAAVVTERTTHRTGRRTYRRSRTYVRVRPAPGQGASVPKELELSFAMTAWMNMDLTGPVAVAFLDGRPLGLVDASGDAWSTASLGRRWIRAERQLMVWSVGAAVVSCAWVAPLSRRCFDERLRRRHRLFEPPTMWYALVVVAALPLWLSSVSAFVAWSVFGLLFVPSGWTFVLACRWLRSDEPVPTGPARSHVHREADPPEASGTLAAAATPPPARPS